ncbi:amino acid ABC transporter permease [Desulfoscipio geothermicus]|uniref:Glutamine transport system permease protein n=1 Tax=Desulfoscipio geothermicus DSM 3669 TaxID=1121426 RepID=A0A1I6CNL2_9FIRM|nr:amino acid ABC transporter permease [Desulfoscipio geothermicus]SFQ94733.1 glutamine transport system permease protein [Desulfoscipio geothermicus DSM 3669]
MVSGFNLDWGIAIYALPLLLGGIKLTIIITIAGLFFGFLLGAAAGLARTSKNKPLYGIATVYVEAIRGTPILVQALYLYFGVNQLLMQTINWKIESVPAGIIAIAINSGAYIAEIVRGAVQSIDKGQVEAGRSLGLSSFKTFYYVVWPQAFKRMIPPLGNQFIISLKDTSLFAFIAVGELLRQGQIVISATFAAFEIYTMVAVLYLAMTLSISTVLRFVEKRLDVS